MPENTEPWDYVAEAGALWLLADDGEGLQALREAVPYWLQTTAARSALEYAELVAKGIPRPHALTMVVSGADHMIAYDAAQEIHGLNYEEWLAGPKFNRSFPSSYGPPDNQE
jgi:hypothetical protein